MSEGEYVVERIDKTKVIDGETFYFIKWKGWAETYNTWEPRENLNGCPQKLKEFERRQGKTTVRRARGGASINEQDDREDIDKALAETAHHMKSYGILPKWPADKEPLAVQGVMYVGGELVYIVKRKSTQRSQGLTRSNANLVNAKTFRIQFPELVIRFYESRLLWTDNDKLEEDQATVASQSTLLHQNVGSRRGKMIANDVDCKLREMYSERKGLTKSVELEPKNMETQDIEDDEALEEEEIQDMEEKSNGEDTFGLPSNLDHGSSDETGSGSDSELEEIDLESKQNQWNWERPNEKTNGDTSDEDTNWNWKRCSKTSHQNLSDNEEGEVSAY